MCWVSYFLYISTAGAHNLNSCSKSYNYKGPALGFIRCCYHLAIWTRCPTFSFCIGPTNYVARAVHNTLHKPTNRDHTVFTVGFSNVLLPEDGHTFWVGLWDLPWWACYLWSHLGPLHSPFQPHCLLVLLLLHEGPSPLPKTLSPLPQIFLGLIPSLHFSVQMLFNRENFSDHAVYNVPLSHPIIYPA